VTAFLGPFRDSAVPVRRRAETGCGRLLGARPGTADPMTQELHLGRLVLPAAAGFGPLAERPVPREELQEVEPRRRVENLERIDMPPAGVEPTVAPGGRGVTADDLPLDVPPEERAPGPQWANADHEAETTPGADSPRVVTPLRPGDEPPPPPPG